MQGNDRNKRMESDDLTFWFGIVAGIGASGFACLNAYNGNEIATLSSLVGSAAGAYLVKLSME